LIATADPLPFSGAQLVADPSLGALTVVTWGLDGYGAVGAGLVQADAALDALP